MAQQTLICIGCQYSRVSTLLAARDVCDSASLRSKRFCLVSEQRKTSVLAAREMKREPKNERGGRGREGGREVSFPPHLLPDLFLTTLFARSVTLVPRSLLVNRTETLAMQATIRPPKFHSVDVHLLGIWPTSADWSTRETFLATKCEDTRLYSLAMICEREFQICSRPVRVNWNEYVWTGENAFKNDTIRVDTTFFGNNKREKFLYAIEKTGYS